MDENHFDVFQDKEKAMHQALWLSFKDRVNKTEFGIVPYPTRKWAVIKSEVAEDLDVSFEKIPSDYSELNYDIIRHIKMDKNPLRHLEELLGVFSVMDGELLRYILHGKIPLEKLIRYELASRGFDENHDWIGFDRAEEIWLE
jgi:hypothetical protein